MVETKGEQKNIRPTPVSELVEDFERLGLKTPENKDLIISPEKTKLLKSLIPVPKVDGIAVDPVTGETFIVGGAGLLTEKNYYPAIHKEMYTAPLSVEASDLLATFFGERTTQIDYEEHFEGRFNTLEMVIDKFLVPLGEGEETLIPVILSGSDLSEDPRVKSSIEKAKLKISNYADRANVSDEDREIILKGLEKLSGKTSS